MLIQLLFTSPLLLRPALPPGVVGRGAGAALVRMADSAASDAGSPGVAESRALAGDESHEALGGDESQHMLGALEKWLREQPIESILSRDQAAALAAFEACARRGHTSALFNLGVMYRWGEGCRKDIARSFVCYHAAATRHGGGREGCPCEGYTAHVAAQNNCGHLMLEWAHKPAAALRFFRTAARNGHPDAQARAEQQSQL